MTLDGGMAQMAQQVRRRANTRAQLLRAADALIEDSGTTRLSIDEVCRAAGFTRGAFYSNFASIDELLFALYAAKSEALVASLDAALDTPGGDEPHPESDETLEDAVDRFLAAVPADAQWYALRAAFAMRAGHDESIAEALRSHAEDLRIGLTPYVERMSVARLADPAEATRIVIAAHVGAVLQGPLVEDPERLRRDTVLAAVRGLPRAEQDHRDSPRSAHGAPQRESQRERRSS